MMQPRIPSPVVSECPSRHPQTSSSEVAFNKHFASAAPAPIRQPAKQVPLIDGSCAKSRASDFCFQSTFQTAFTGPVCDRELFTVIRISWVSGSATHSSNPTELPFIVVSITCRVLSIALTSQVLPEKVGARLTVKTPSNRNRRARARPLRLKISPLRLWKGNGVGRHRSAATQVLHLSARSALMERRNGKHVETACGGG